MTSNAANESPGNSISDVEGVRVGNAASTQLASGVTAVVFDAAMTAAASVFGGGPGTRDLDAIGLEGSVGAADAIVFSGGSAFGLDAASGVQAYLRECGRGFPVGAARVPIVPQAILFDLLNGGDKAWGRYPPYRELAYEAARSACATFAIGSQGAGFGATVALPDGGRLRGGLGTASDAVMGISAEPVRPIIVGALAAVNAAGMVTVAGSKHFLAAPYEKGHEFGGKGPCPAPLAMMPPVLKGYAASNTTLCIVATNAVLSRAECKRLSIMAAAGLPRAISPVFTPLDGDIVFAISSGAMPLDLTKPSLAVLGAHAANCLTRSIARGVFAASGALPDGTPCYADLFGM